MQANPFQLEVISKIPEDEPITLYKAGPFIEITKGPHLPNTNLVRAIKATKVTNLPITLSYIYFLIIIVL